MNYNNFYGEKDYYCDEGCCLTCEDAMEGCLCYDCKCTQCSHYIIDLGKCAIALAYKEKWEKIEIQIDDIKKTTEKAILIECEGDEIWLPQSLTKAKAKDIIIKDQSLAYWFGKPKKKVIFTISIPKWLAFEKGLMDLDDFFYWRGED